jgi:light-regulated signal transduction histidine kinase (bacteriophytochrome)
LKIDLNEILASVAQDFELAIEEKIAKISIGEMPVVEGVAFQLAQVFQNLISNSLKFNDPKRPLEIVIVCSKIDNEFFRISYSDNGIGFNHKFNHKVFEVFQRLHPKDIYEGTGIGLSIVKKIISLHNGTITASGIEGEGARFDMVLPYTQKNQSISDVRKILV